MPNGDNTMIRIDQNRYREYNILFSSNSCNFITATDRAKTDCPKGYVFCNKKSSPLLVDREMTFVEAVEHCGKLNTSICMLNLHSKCDPLYYRCLQIRLKVSMMWL